jgi:hypothetical protein
MPAHFKVAEGIADRVAKRVAQSIPDGWYEHSLEPDYPAGYALYVVDGKAVLSSYVERDADYEATNFQDNPYGDVDATLDVVFKATEGRTAKQMELEEFEQLMQAVGIQADIREQMDDYREIYLTEAE